MSLRYFLPVYLLAYIIAASETLPITVVIDPEGTVRDVIEGILYSDEFDQKVKPLLETDVKKLAHKASKTQ